VDEDLAATVGLFEEVIAWLRDHYSEFEFSVERDLVWTLQSRLRKVIKERSLPYSVINDYPMLPGAGRARSADLVIRDADSSILVAAEFKYEPSHRRSDLLRAKLPVVFWGTTVWRRTSSGSGSLSSRAQPVSRSPSSSMKEATSVTGPLIQGRYGLTGQPAIPAVMKSRFYGLAGLPN
jgi:hypothetical protein